MSIKALIFDMDGTMIDSMPYHKQSWAEFARRQGLTQPIEDLMCATTGRTGTECMSQLFGREMAFDEALHLVEEKEAIYRELFTPHFCEVAGFKAFMDVALRQGMAVGVGTAGDAANVAFAFSHLKLAPEPSVVIRGDMGLAGKPHPDIFLEAAKRLGFEPSECIVFEDAPLGIEAARRAGMRAVALTTTHTAEELAGDHVIDAAPNYQVLMDEDFFKLLA
jgi:beta-phosphoglucomutase-like phosphatase (HAD superfamily)